MNSNTPPQEILIKVMCSERLPRDDRYYHVEDDYSFYSK